MGKMEVIVKMGNTLSSHIILMTMKMSLQKRVRHFKLLNNHLPDKPGILFLISIQGK